MRVVIDTNVIISAMFFGGPPLEVLKLLLRKKIAAYASVKIIAEYALSSVLFISKYPERAVGTTLSTILSCINIINPTSKIHISRDPDDDKFIECAVDAKCDCIISGDNDLRVLKEYEGIAILSASEFISQYGKSLN